MRNYRAPGCAEPARFELPARPPGLYQFLARQAAAMRTVVVATGLSSEVRYASVQPGDMFRVYCPPGTDFIACLGQMRCERFANLEVVETADPSVYFDARQDEGGFWWASPVQTYLELMAGSRRDQETASQVKAGIVAGLGEAAQAEPAQSR